MSAAAPHATETWLSVQEASAMLGVSPATLRRWSAAGEVEAFTTPGGHRRFSLTTLKAVLQQGTTDVSRPSGLGESSERMVRVLRRHARAASSSLPEMVRDEAFRARM
ncbi:MAG TPA: helix-turn-helix domain-containing protein, partial [Propionibacterium sp.]|nr:helix-turn-helix domain-containing protein [Propionibacterium sp.]